MSHAEPKQDSTEKIAQELARERDRLRLLLDSSNALIFHRDLRALFNEISKYLRDLFHHALTVLTLYDEEEKILKMYAVDFPSSKGAITESIRIPLEGTPAGIAFRELRPVWRSKANPNEWGKVFKERALVEGLNSGCVVP